MKALNRIFQALAILGALVSAGLYWSLSQGNSDAELQLEFAGRQLNVLKSQKKQLQEQLEKQGSALEAATEDRDATLAKNTSLSAQLGQLQRENLRLLDEREARIDTEKRLQDENARLKRELAETRARSVPQEQIAGYEKTIADLERQILELRETSVQSVATNGETSNFLSAPPSNPSLQGKVLTVGKGSSFVVLNIGYNDGVRLTNELLVHHADTSIAKIQVTEVKENLSIARVLPESLVKIPQTGDSVSSLN